MPSDRIKVCNGEHLTRRATVNVVCRDETVMSDFDDLDISPPAQVESPQSKIPNRDLLLPERETRRSPRPSAYKYHNKYSMHVAKVRPHTKSSPWESRHHGHIDVSRATA